LRLARAFVECKAEISAANARDDIVGNVDQASAVLIATFLTACIDGHREQFAEPLRVVSRNCGRGTRRRAAQAARQLGLDG